MGVLSKGQFIEADREKLVAEYVGQTAVKTKQLISKAIGGVLFIDEAYSLDGGPHDSFGKEAVENLLKEMEDHRDDLVVIVAGYTEEMHRFIDMNPGLASRFNNYIEFLDYSSDDLMAIFMSICKQHDNIVTEECRETVYEILDNAYRNRTKNFGNARLVRNIYEKMYKNRAERLAGKANLSKKDMMEFTLKDIEGVDDELNI